MIRLRDHRFGSAKRRHSCRAVWSGHAGLESAWSAHERLWSLPEKWALRVV